MQIALYVGFVSQSETALQSAYRNVANRRQRDAGIRDGCRRMANSIERRLGAIRRLREMFGAGSGRPVKLLDDALFHGLRSGGVGLIRDLHDLTLLANQSLLYWTALDQALKAIQAHSAEAICAASVRQLELEVSWLTTEIKDAAPQALTVPTAAMDQMIGVCEALAQTAVHAPRGTSLLKAAAVASVGALGYVLGRRRAASSEMV